MTIVVKTAVFWQQRAMTCGTCSCDRAGQDSLRDPGETIYLHAEPLRMISAIRRKMPMLLAPRRIAATTSWVARCLALTLVLDHADQQVNQCIGHRAAAWPVQGRFPI